MSVYQKISNADTVRRNSLTISLKCMMMSVKKRRGSKKRETWKLSEKKRERNKKF
jgi:hypothetical protein